MNWLIRVRISQSELQTSSGQYTGLQITSIFIKHQSVSYISDKLFGLLKVKTISEGSGWPNQSNTQRCTKL